MKKINLIVVDDHEMFRSGMESLLKKNIDFEVYQGVGTRSELDELGKRLNHQAVVVAGRCDHDGFCIRGDG